MGWGTVTIGGVAFREENLASDGSGLLRISGQESAPPSSAAWVIAAHHNVHAAKGLILPVVFSDKADLTGFYLVTDASSDLFRWSNGAVETATWSMSLQSLGTERDVEIESRLPPIARTTELGGLTAVFWQAPAPGFGSYYTGATVPSGSVTRTAVDGAVVVQTGIPVGVSPRWTIPAGSYLLGAVKVLLDGLLRLGEETPAASAWEMNNGLVRVMSSSSGGFTVSAWGGTIWESVKTFQVTVAGAALTSTPEMTVIRNTPEQAILRLSYPTAVGRVTADMGLRRGSRFVTGVLKRQSAASLGVTRLEAETAAVVTGGLRASAADTDGNRFVMGSSKSVTTTTATASITKASVTAFDFFLGHEFGASPAAGDAMADLLAQYLGSGSERVRIVRR